MWTESMDGNFLNRDYSQIDKPHIDLNSKRVKIITAVILVVIFAPWFLIGTALIGVSAYSVISDNNKTKDYSETVGRLVDYEEYEERFDEEDDEEDDEEEDSRELSCKGVYEYTVNGTTYQGSPKRIGKESDFEETISVKYNPDNPSEFVMDSRQETTLIYGIIIILVVTVVFIVIIISIKKILDKINSLINRDDLKC